MHRSTLAAALALVALALAAPRRRHRGGPRGHRLRPRRGG